MILFFFSINLNLLIKPVKVKQKTYGTGIGKYINRAAKRAEISAEPDADTDPTVSKKKKKKRGLSDFSEW